MKNHNWRVFLGGLVLSLVPVSGLGHGETELGPHRGVIRMPGAFHTEVKALNERKVAVYLLDIQFKNPSVKDSEVRLSVKKKSPGGAEPMSVSCEAMKSWFECRLPQGQSLKKGDEVSVLAKREGAQGGAAVYTYPFVPAPKPAKVKKEIETHMHGHGEGSH